MSKQKEQPKLIRVIEALKNAVSHTDRGAGVYATCLREQAEWIPATIANDDERKAAISAYNAAILETEMAIAKAPECAGYASISATTGNPVIKVVAWTNARSMCRKVMAGRGGDKALEELHSKAPSYAALTEMTKKPSDPHLLAANKAFATWCKRALARGITKQALADVATEGLNAVLNKHALTASDAMAPEAEETQQPAATQVVTTAATVAPAAAQ